MGTSNPTASNTAAISVQNLSIAYGRKKQAVPALINASITVNAGDFLGILGESGSGKSTLARAILGLTARSGRITGGSVLIDGRNILPMRPGGRRSYISARVGYVPQNPFASLNPVIKLWRQFGDSIPGPRARVLESAEDLLQAVGIREPGQVLNGYAHQLSGGMAQRVVIALALAKGPSIIIADEPTTALDVLVQRRILDLFQSLTQAPRNIGVIFVTHNVGLASSYASSVAVMYRGEIIERGLTRQVLDHPTHWYTNRLVDAVPQRPTSSVAAESPL